MCFFFFNDTATTEIYTLSLHDALPISRGNGFTSASTCGVSCRPAPMARTRYSPILFPWESNRRGRRARKDSSYARAYTTPSREGPMLVPLTPLEFARRTRALYPDREALVDGNLGRASCRERV